MSEQSIRNIGIFGHASCGKTTIADAFLYLAGGNTRFGKVTEKTSVFDFEPEEIDKVCSINIGLATFDYNDVTISLIDTPGYSDFLGEAISGLTATDCALMVIDATGGIEVGTERLLQIIEEKNLPLIFFINKLKKEGTDYGKTFQAIKETTKRSIVPLTIPIGEAEKLSGVIDIMQNQAFGPEGKKIEIPADMKAMVDEYKDKVTEAAAEIDDALMNKYVEGQKIELAESMDVIRNGIVQGKIALCCAGDAFDMIGIKSLINTVVELMPSPDKLPDIEWDSQKIKRSHDAPFVGQIFKTTVEPHLGEVCMVKVLSGTVKTGDTVKNLTQSSEEKINQIYLIKGKDRKEVNQLTSGMIAGFVKLKGTHTGDTLAASGIKSALPKIDFPAPSISMAIVPKAKGDEEKISNGLARLHDEDPTFQFAYDPEIKQLIISGIGELHLDIILSRLKRKYGVAVDLTKPRMKYRETFTRKTEAQGKYKKQTGGHGQYGDCWLRVEPMERGTGFEFVNGIVGGKIPSRYIPSVEKGVKEALQNGLLAGYPVTDIKVTVFEGSYHPVDSSDIAFKIAASMALKANASKGSIVLLEPISEVEIYVPETFMGDVMGDLNSRRGKIMGMEAVGKNQKIKALVPEAEMYKYSTSLRSLTQGRGFFDMKFHHYEEVPKEITKRIVEESKKQKEE
ncbi:MAG: elongation factor G [candidate division WOR-3 bacterium]|nr:MAG: elongation factor G [candidate division WOR-3 bacterium]